jgi:WD40 repeat protein
MRHLLVLAICLLPDAAHAADPPRTDRYGDPLPEGALARLGSVWLRHAGLGDFVLLPDGKTAVTAGRGHVRSWELTSGKQTRAVKLRGAPGAELVVSLSPDGRLLAAADRSRVAVWDAATGEELKSIPWPKQEVAFLRFSSDGAELVVGYAVREVALLDWRTGRQRPVLPDARFGADSTFHGYFTDDGKRLVAGGGWGQPLVVFDVAAGKELRRLWCNARTSAVTPDRKTLVACCMRDKGDSDLRVFDLESGEEKARFDLEDSYYSLAISPDGAQVACGASDRGCVLDLRTGKVVHRLTGWPWGLAFTPDGQSLVASEGRTRLRVWDAATGREANDRPGNLGRPGALAVSPDGRLVASADWMTPEVTLWDPTDGRAVRQLPLKGEGRYVRDLAFSADGRTLWAAQGMGFIQFWDPTTGAELQSVQLGSAPQAAPALPGSAPYFYHLRVFPGAARAATLERVLQNPETTRLAVWDLTTGKTTAERSLPAGQREWAWAGLSVALPMSGGLSVVAPETGRVRFVVPSASPGGPVAASPDGRLVAAQLSSPGGPAPVGVWEVATGRRVATTEVGPCTHLTIGPDGRTLVVAGEGGLRVWDLAAGRERGRRATDAGATGLVLDAHGQRVVTSLADGTGLVWDLAGFPVAALSDGAGPKELSGWWAEMLKDDAGSGYAALWRLSGAPPGVVVPFLAANLRPSARPDPAAVRGWVRDLDNNDFRVRQKGAERLAALGRLVEGDLRQAVRESDSAEVRKRAGELLTRLTDGVPSGESLRAVRAVAVLERLGTAQARKLLAELAGGAAGAFETEEAKSALARLNARPSGP